MARNRESKRGFDPISLSFLDVISCGFGAVVLIFLILDHSISSQADVESPELSAEINLLDEEILEGESGLVRVRNTLSDLDLRMVEAQGLARIIEEEIESIIEQLVQIENESAASDNSVEKLRSDIEALQTELERLRAAEQFSGSNVRPFVGEGNRQYLTGLILGGNRILVLVDVSASMLDSTIVNVALPTIAAEMQATAATSIWVINAYQLAITALLLPLAALGDRIGYHRVYLPGVGVFILGSIACAAARIAFDHGLIVETAGPEDEVLKLLPPLTIDETELERGLEIIRTSLHEALAADVSGGPAAASAEVNR